MMKQNIIIVIYDFSRKGGAQRVAANLADSLCRTAGDVTLVSLQFSGEKCPFPPGDGVVLRRLVPGAHRLREVFVPAVRELKRIIREKENPVVFAISDASVSFCLAAAGKKTPVVFCPQASLSYRVPGAAVTNAKTFLSIRAGVRFSDRVAVLTQYEKREYEKMFPGTEKKLYAIYNWLDPAFLRRAKPYDPFSKTILTVGRIAPDKNCEDILAAAPAVFDRHPDWTWLLYGDEEGGYAVTFREKLRKAGLDSHVRLMGHTDSMAESYGGCAMLVHVSHVEGFGLVLIEAQANHLPVVAYAGKGGMCEILADGTDGTLVPCGDTAALAARVNDLIEHPEKRIQLASHAADRLSRFSKDAVTEQWTALLRSLDKESMNL